MTALLCGDLGMWPPYLQGEAGAVRLIRPMARGIALAIAAIRDAAPDTTLMSIDGALEFLPAALDRLDDLSQASRDPTLDSGTETASPDVLAAATILGQRTFLASDLIRGRVDARHPLADWLTEHGMTEADLIWHQEHAVDTDIVGLNYYPQFTVRSLQVTDEGITPRSEWAGVAGLERAVRAFARRYGKPVMITETDVNASVERRSEWLRDSIEAVRRIRRAGLPLVGYTWWPLYALVDWGYRTGSPLFFDETPSPVTARSWSVESYLASMGLYDLEPMPDGTVARVRTPLVDRYAAEIGNGPGPLHVD